jgi:hypothetical protein
MIEDEYFLIIGANDLIEQTEQLLPPESALICGESLMFYFLKKQEDEKVELTIDDEIISVVEHEDHLNDEIDL